MACKTAAYFAALAVAKSEYEAATAEAWAWYKSRLALVPLGPVGDAARDALRTSYRVVTAPALEAYDKACALALTTLEKAEPCK